MLSRNFLPFQKVDSWYGVNAKDTYENMLDGEWNEASINIISDPQGGVTSRPGFSAITSASIGASVAWCGFYQFRKSTKSNYFLGGASNGKIYGYASNAYTQLYTGMGTSDDDDRFRFAQLDDICVIVDGNKAPLKYTGTGSCASLGGTMVTADFCIEAWRYMWLHSTVDPRLLYYCTTLGSIESGYTSFLNFDEDPYEVIGASRQGDDMLVFKTWSIFRIEYTGTEPKFPKTRITSNIGTPSHDTIKELPDKSVMFLGSDFNIYRIFGNDIIEVGDNIKKLIKSGVNSRLPYATAGILKSRGWYWLSFTYTSSSTQNDKTLICDYNRPYKDKFGKLQYPWFIFSIGANCFTEIYASGKSYLYHGGYTGKMYYNDSGTNDDGSAFSAIYKSKPFSHGDTTLEKKYSKLFLSYENKGSHNLTITITCDENANTQKVITQSMSGGSGYNTLWDVAQWDVDYWSSSTDIDIGRDIDRVGKLIDITFSVTGLNEAFNIYNHTILAKPLRRGTVRVRETT
jgi:hypothetical protein